MNAHIDSMLNSGYHETTMVDEDIGRDATDGSDILKSLATSLNLGKHYGSRREFDLRYKFREARESQRKMVTGDEIHECGPRGEGFRTSSAKTSYFKTCDKLVVLCTMYDSQRPNSFSLSEVPGKPTHYKLKLITHGLSRRHPIYNVCIQEDDRKWYLSHQLLRTTSSEELGLSAKGNVADPITGAGDGQLVLCIQCSTWPPASFSMVQRLSRSDWPNKEVKDKMVRKGCFVVPSDDDQDGEAVFMLSFAVPERELIRSLNQTQINVYGYWLTILEQKMPDSLKAVFNETVVKHCLFWVIQDYPPDLWVEVNVARCMDLVLKKFFDVTRNRSCPNFFVKRYDMFMTMTPNLQVNLLNFLHTIQEAGQDYFLELEPFCQRAEQFHNLQQSFAEMCVKDLEEERRLDFAFFQEVFHTCFEIRRLFQYAVKTSMPFNLEVFETIIRNLEERSSPLLDDNIKTVLKGYWSLLMACHMCRNIPNVVGKRPADITRVEDMLKEGLHADMSSAKLKTATLYLHVGKVKDAVKIINDLVTDARADHVIDLERRCKLSGWIENQRIDQAYEQSACDKGLSRAEKVARFMALPYTITSDEEVIVPEVIQYELAVNDGHVTSNFRLYCYLLLIICKHRLGEEVNQLIETLRQLVTESRDHESVHMYYNWLGYCLMLVQSVPEAQQCFHESINIKPSGNAAEKHLEAFSKK
ncbi:uncharacterized protein LOC132558871 [Ylistrum balloti]|uniref:uncharacterized protein LOC132558871 n=1 Tax=Ylistrum balloti TaxID=509963 RepID=UPI002905A802|nr:uncharacterized protein LOC132558871 [Ylistrum balloti]